MTINLTPTPTTVTAEEVTPRLNREVDLLESVFFTTPVKDGLNITFVEAEIDGIGVVQDYETQVATRYKLNDEVYVVTTAGHTVNLSKFFAGVRQAIQDAQR